MYNVGLTLFYQDVVRLPLDCHSHEVRQETRLDWGRQVACLVKLQVVDSVWLDHCPTSHCTYSIRTAAADRRKLHLLHLKTHSARVLWEQVVIWHSLLFHHLSVSCSYSATCFSNSSMLWCCWLADRKGIWSIRRVADKLKRHKIYFGGTGLTWSNYRKIGQINNSRNWQTLCIGAEQMLRFHSPDGTTFFVKWHHSAILKNVTPSIVALFSWRTCLQNFILIWFETSEP